MSSSINPLVSVIIPSYNAERFVRTCIEGVFAQSLTNLEIICIDDGSRDGTASIVETLMSLDDRIHLIRQDNAGPGAARNAGIDKAQGAFLTFLDADDRYSSNNYLEVLLRGAQEHEQLVAAGEFYNDRGDEGVERDFSDSTHFDGYSFVGEGVVPYANYQFDYGFHRFLFSRELFAGGRNRFPQLTFYEDPVFLVRILAEAQTFFATNKVGYLYRCEYKPVRWTTEKTLDFLEGVRANLVFSKTHNLAKLHWYTAHHFNKESRGICLGYNRALDVERVGVALQQVLQCIDRELLAEVEEEDRTFDAVLRDEYDAIVTRPRWKSFVGSLRYDMQHRG